MTHLPYIAAAYAVAIGVPLFFAIEALFRVRSARRRLAAIDTGRSGASDDPQKATVAVAAGCGVGLGSAAALTLSAFSDNLVFFVSPSDLAKSKASGRQVRLGGLVEQGTVEKTRADRRGRSSRSRTATPAFWLSIKAFFRTCSVRVKVLSCSARSKRTACSARPRCWPSTMRPTCRRKSPTR